MSNVATNVAGDVIFDGNHVPLFRFGTNTVNVDGATVTVDTTTGDPRDVNGDPIPQGTAAERTAWMMAYIQRQCTLIAMLNGLVPGNAGAAAVAAGPAGIARNPARVSTAPIVGILATTGGCS